MTQNGPNFSNLVNIQIVNSRENTQTETTKEHVPKPLSDMQRSKLRIAHLNVRSIKNRNHLIQVRELMKDSNYDILAISESWLNSTVTNAEVEIEGFKLTRLDRLEKTGGGVCVYSKSSIKVKCLKNITGISEFGFHQLWMLIQLRKLRSILLCATYRPDYCPTSTFHDIFMENYLHALTLGKEIIVIGDLNCDLLKPDSPETMSLLDFCTIVNQTQIIKEPTRVTETSSSLIDIIMTSNVSLVENYGVGLSHISDHYLIYASLKLKMSKLPPSYKCVRSYKNYEPDSFLADLQRISWYDISTMDDANVMLDHFNEKFLHVMDTHAPVKTVKIKHRSCPFINTEIRDLMQYRNNLLKIARSTKSTTDWEIYRKFKKEVKSKLRDAEREYVRKELEHSHNINSKWKIIKNCIPRKESTQQIYTKDFKEVANEFNQFFTSVGRRASEVCASLIELYNLPAPSTIVSPAVTESQNFSFVPVSRAEVRRTIMAFQSNKAPGYDKVRMSTIKDALPCILPVVTDIINRSLQTSVFPSAWKISEVIPLLKEGDHEVANNNRPLSLLPAISKICERVALNQLTSYMNEKKCLSKHQSGNKKLHSCETLGVFMTDKVFKAIDSKELTVIVLLDFSKAFDSIDHRKLLTKLKALGLSLGALEWFKSYLTGRTQQVKIGSVVSESGLITHGVPQGSILGPVLFNIYLNDLPTIPNFGDLESYVDDSKLYLSFPIKYVSEVMWNINEDLSKITAWCCHNSLLINPDKTKVLVLGTSKMLQRLPDDFHVTLIEKRITPTISARDLGIQFDSTLSFNEHIANTVSTCIAILCQINRVKHLFDPRMLESIISFLVFSKLYYCSNVWSSTSKKNIERLQKVQNFAARIITGTQKYEHITPILKQLNWLPVSDMLKYFVGVLAFKCLNGLAPDYLNSYFQERLSLHDRNTRNKQKLNIPAYRSAAGQRTFEYRAVSLWNSLPCNITVHDNSKDFKSKLYNYLFELFLLKS